MVWFQDKIKKETKSWRKNYNVSFGIVLDQGFKHDMVIFKMRAI